jgi:hypothetical protein
VRLVGWTVLALGLVGGALVSCGRPSATPAQGSADASPPNTTFLPRGIEAAPYVAIDKVASDCSVPMGSSFQATTASEVVSLLTGRWQRCDGAFGGGATFDGLELDRNRRWQVLALDKGALAPATGLDSRAIWFLSAEAASADAAVADPLAHLQLIFDEPTTMSGIVDYNIELFQNPTRLRLVSAITFTWLGE